MDACNTNMMMSSNGNIFRAAGLSARGIHRSPVNSPHKGQWRGALILSLICVWTNNWANDGDDGDLTHHRAHSDVTVVNYKVLWNVRKLTECGLFLDKVFPTDVWKSLSLRRVTSFMTDIYADVNMKRRNSHRCRYWSRVQIFFHEL